MLLLRVLVDPRSALIAKSETSRLSWTISIMLKSICGVVVFKMLSLVACILSLRIFVSLMKFNMSRAALILEKLKSYRSSTHRMLSELTKSKPFVLMVTLKA